MKRNKRVGLGKSGEKENITAKVYKDKIKDNAPSRKKRNASTTKNTETENNLVLKLPSFRDTSSFHDSIYHAIKKEQDDKIKEKSKTRRERLKQLKNVDVSTPKYRYKRKGDLYCDISPIRIEKVSGVRNVALFANSKELRKSSRKLDPLEEKIDVNVPDIVISDVKHVHFDDVFDKQEMIKEKTLLKPGKWRRSLISWRKSHNPGKLANCTSRKISLFPIRTDPGIRQTMQQSVLLEQSDEGSLQSEQKSILDSSIECASIHKSYVLQRKASRRETSVFKKSSIFYGLSAPLIDLDALSALNARQIVLRRCGLIEPLRFDDIYCESQLPNLKKIGEGVYGEVFMYKPTDDEPIVLKIIPIEGNQIVNGGQQKNFSEILSEIIIAEELSQLSIGKENKTDGFVKIKSVRCVKGVYPQHLLDAWEIYNDSCLKGSENDNPEIFDDDQLYIVFEQYNAGIDLEAFIFKNGQEAFSIFLQVALTLAVAENKFEFEHRDLHWGNILISRTNDKFIEYHVDGKVYEIPSYGVKATIIDFTLSRMVYDGAVIYDNLANDPELFESSGDYQFDIYRFMRCRLDNNFERYDPYTNLLWLHYLIDKLIDGARYKYSKSDKHKSALNKMMKLRDSLMEQHQSASDFVKSLKT